MNKTKITLLLMIAFLVLAAVACEKNPEKKKVEEIAPAPIVVKAWEPTAFSLDTDRLPPNYLGIDPVKFYEMFKSKVENIKKGEFETAKDFAQRTANKDLLLSPINTSDLYAFRISDIKMEYHIKYNADAQTYRIDYSCKETYSFGNFGKSKNWVTCKVDSISRKTDTYAGSNAFGASRNVERTEGHDFALAIPKGSVALRAAFSKDREPTDYYKWRERFRVPLEKARNLKSMELALLFIGRVKDAKIIKGQTTILKPTIDDPFGPRDIYITEDAVPFEIKKIVFYVVQTGEILWQRAY